MTRNFILSAVLFTLLLFLVGASSVRSQSGNSTPSENQGITLNQQQAPSVSDTSQISDKSVADGETTIPFNFEKIWELLDFWRWPLLGCLILGVVIVVVKVFRIFWDIFQGGRLRREPLHQMKLKQIEALIAGHPKGSLSGLLYSLLQVYKTSHTLEALGSEVQLFRQAMEDRIEGVRHWLTYLSTAAGALGLLGTVWGMFITFYGGQVKHESAIHGMGVALVTTGVGILISLVIDMGSTVVQSLGNRDLSISLQKAEEFREASLQDLHSTKGGTP